MHLHKTLSQKIGWPCFPQRNHVLSKIHCQILCSKNAPHVTTNQEIDQKQITAFGAINVSFSRGDRKVPKKHLELEHWK